MTDLPLDRKPPAKPGKKRPLPYELRAQKPGAGIVSPVERAPASARLWPKWTMKEAARQGQQELFPDHESSDPDLAAVRQLRRKRRMGVFS